MLWSGFGHAKTRSRKGIDPQMSQMHADLDGGALLERLAREFAIYVGDVFEGLSRLPDASVQCCVTSPPYWGLRDYGVEGQIGLEASLDAFRDVSGAACGRA